MFWFGLLAAVAVIAVARFLRSKPPVYVGDIVPFRWTAEDIETARKFMERERQNAR